jgi:hypothetical protein
MVENIFVDKIAKNKIKNKTLNYFHGMPWQKCNPWLHNLGGKKGKKKCYMMMWCIILHNINLGPHIHVMVFLFKIFSATYDYLNNVKKISLKML